MNTVDLYLFELDQWADQADLSLLSDEETMRYNRFATPNLKQHFATCHALKRLVLSEYLACSAQTITFEASENGKPRVQANQNPNAIEFNLSHSCHYLLLGISRKGPIGVDIEERRKTNHLQLARRFFHPLEVKAIEQSDIPDQTFFEIWVQKEAYLKMTGAGISAGLENFNVLACDKTQIIQIPDTDCFASVCTQKSRQKIDLKINRL